MNYHLTFKAVMQACAVPEERPRVPPECPLALPQVRGACTKAFARRERRIAALCPSAGAIVQRRGVDNGGGGGI